MKSNEHHGHHHSHTADVKKVDRLSPTQVRLTVEFAAGTLDEHVNMTAQQFAREAKLPGFRPGKAPIGMVKDRYRADIEKEVLSHLLQAGVAEALEKTGMNPLEAPRVGFEDVVFGANKPFQFFAEFEVEPEIQLHDYRGIPLQVSDVEVSDEEVTRTLDELREQFATMEPLEEVEPKKGYWAVVEVGFSTEGENSKSEEAKTYTVELGTGRLFTELDDAFMTLKVGESKSVQGKFPENYPSADLAGKPALFNCKLVELKKKVLPEVNDELAAMIKEKATLEQLMKDIRDSILSSKTDQNTSAQREQVLEYLLLKNPFEPPVSMVERQARRLLEAISEDRKRAQAPFNPSDEELKAVHEQAKRMVRGSLLLKQIGEKEKIELSSDRWNAKLDATASSLKRSREEAEKLLSGRGMLDRLRNEVLTDQVFDFLVQSATIKKVPVKGSGA